MNFPRLSLPMSGLKLKTDNDVTSVFCLVRKKWIILTPEEWVRQHFIAYLNSELNYPLSHMAAEKQIIVNGLKKRFDISCANSSGKIILLVECKSADIELSNATFNQAARYNLTLKVPFLIITNGMTHFCAKIDLDNSSIDYLREIPSYETI